ncbi:MAG: NADAR family protein [Bacilli bacterium]
MINSFKNKYFFLSNYYPCFIEYKGIKYRNNEAAFHAQKDLSRSYEFQLLTPDKAKKLGRQVKLRQDWEEIKDEIMYEINLEKFKQNEDLKIKLLDTKDEELIEGNNWNDTYWGVCNGIGKNKLGKILMRIRSEFNGVN